MTPSIRFLGAAATVRGRRFLVRAGAAQVLVETGLFGHAPAHLEEAALA
jgi:hypothetical protein